MSIIKESFCSLTGIDFLSVYFVHESIYPSLIASTCSRVPPVDEIEFGADLVANTSRGASGVERISKCASGIQSPIRVNTIVIKVENSSEVVSKDDVDV